MLNLSLPGRVFLCTLPTETDGQRARAGEHGLVLKPAELDMLLAGIDLSSVKRHKRYQRPQPTPANTPSLSASSFQ